MNLSTLREALGISQNKLDRLAKVPIGTVNAIEAGRNKNPSVAMCLAIISGLHEAGARGATVEMVFARPDAAELATAESEAVL